MNRVWFKVAAFITVFIVAVGLSGCAIGNVDQYGSYQVHPKQYTVDGKTVDCLLIRTSKGTASLSCDWDHPVTP